ncbi:MAG: methionyl-tRNA formyltransferase [Ktedonobacteraceae bacterium]
MKDVPRVLFLGMQGSFSSPSLQALVESGVEVCAVVIPATYGGEHDVHEVRADRPALYHREQPRLPRSSLLVLNSTFPTNIVQLAQRQSIPLWKVTRLADPQAVATLAAYRPDFICVSCFSQRIPRAIIDIPHLGCLNVHPSLLPANRGPVPLFWTFHEGREQTGVTIHLMDEGMDSGDILAQRVIPVPTAISYAQLESQCALQGGALLAHTVWELFHGRTLQVPQDESKSSYHSFPREEDYDVSVAEWSAAHVYNFICGVGTWGGTIKLHIDDRVFQVRQAISYSQETQGKWSGKTLFWEGAELWLPCKTGWVGVLSLT